MNDRSLPSSAPTEVRPFKEVWTIAWPTVVTMTSYTVMQFADKIMVAQVGPVHLTAQSNGGIWAFNAMAVAMGIVTVINTYVSQNLGAGRPENGPKYAWAGFWLSAMTWLLVLIPWALVLPSIFSRMSSHSQELQRLESGYAQILLSGSVLMLTSRGLNQYFFGMHRPKVITLGAIAGNITNIIGNYILIYGSDGVTLNHGDFAIHLPGVPGAPALGVYGAAIATVIGTAVELSIPASVFLGRKMNAELRTRAAWRIQWTTIKDLLRLGWPAGVQWGGEIICWSIFMSVLVGQFGEHHMAAGWTALAYMQLSFMPAVGFSVAVTSLVGRYIGAGQPDVAEARAGLGIRLAVGYMTVCGLVFFIFRYQLIGAFIGSDVTPERAAEITAIGGNMLICAAIFQTFDAFGIVYSGALRGAGDTVWPGVITIIYSWLFIVLGGYLLVRFAPGLSSLGPWVAASAYIILYGMTMWRRFAGGRWRTIRLVHTAEEAAGEIAPLISAPPATLPSASVEDIAEAAAATQAAIEGDGPRHLG